MTKSSRSMKVLIVIFSFILLFPAVCVDATIGNVNSFIHSEDCFEGDRDFVDGHRSTFQSKGYPAILLDRPTAVYGLQQHFKNSESVFISCHGDKNGGELVLVSGSSLSSSVFKPTDVPVNMECKLAYLSACKSACKNTATGKNLCSTLISNGYKTAIGYTDNVDIWYSRIYEEVFYLYLTDGMSVYEAFEATNKFLERNYPKVYEEVVPFVAAFGNLGITL